MAKQKPSDELKRRQRTVKAVERAEASEPAAQPRFHLSFPKLLVSVCVLGLFLRLMHTLQTSAVPTTVQLIGDAQGYYAWAERIAAGNWYGSETFYQAPLYPYFLAVVFKTVGTSVMAIRLTQALLGTISIALLGLAARNLFGGKIGIATALLLALYPPAIFYDALVQKASLATCLLCALLASASFLQKRYRLGPAMVVGLVLGLLVLTRENALLWIPLFPLWMWFGFAGTAPIARAKVVAGYLAGLGLILFPVAARNASLGGEWSPTTFQSGPNFYIGNNLDANGVYRALIPGHETPEFERADAQRLAEQAVGRPLSARGVSRYWTQRALAEIRYDPVRWIQLMLVKFGMVVNRYEVPDVESFAVHRFWSTPLLVLGPFWHFGVLAPLAVLGLMLTRSQWRSLWLYYLLILSMIFAVALFFILGRYRLPLVPLMLPFAAAALVRAREWLALRGRSRIAAVTAGLVAAVVCNLPIHDESGLNASSFMNVGISAGKAGDLPTCLRWLSLSVELRPDSAVAHYNLAGAQAMAGRPLQAVDSFRRAKQLDPTLVQVDLRLAQLLEQIGRPEEAVFHYRQALAVEPHDPQAQAGLERLAGRATVPDR